EHSQLIEALASRDSLTGLRNRRAVEDFLASKLASPRASTFPIGCLLVDVDNFAAINEKYGIAVGNEVLKRVAGILFDSCRSEDFLGRYGSDEFIIVLPNTDTSGTIVVGEKLIRNIHQADWSDSTLLE